MTTTLISPKRYVLEQDFYDRDNCVESCETAILTVIGAHQEAELTQRLQYWAYDSERFNHISRPDAGGRWITSGQAKIAGYGVGLIWVTTQTPAALAALEAELLCYHAANTKPILIVQPPDEAFAEQITSMLAACGVEARFVSTDARPANDVAALTSIIEATLIPFKYPGIICLDLADVHTVFEPICVANVKIFRAQNGAALARQLGGMPRFEPAPSSIFVAIYGPPGLTLALVNRCMTEIRARAPGDICVIFTITHDLSLDKDTHHNYYAAYITTCTEGCRTQTIP